jgi:E3 ubiquitin-protein ligase BRE1
MNFQLRGWSERLRRLSEDGMQQSISLGISQTKLTGMHGEAPKLGQALNVLQAKVGSNRLEVAELLIELETERWFIHTFAFYSGNWFLNTWSNKFSFSSRFSKKRLDDDLDLMSSKANSLRDKADNSAVLQKLLHEAKEYRGILKCGICHDRQKEVASHL